MWQKIKKWFGLLDLTKDGKINAEDLELARALAETKYREANEKINEVADRVEVVAEKAKKTATKVKAKTAKAKK